MRAQPGHQKILLVEIEVVSKSRSFANARAKNHPGQQQSRYKCPLWAVSVADVIGELHDEEEQHVAVSRREDRVWNKEQTALPWRERYFDRKPEKVLLHPGGRELGRQFLQFGDLYEFGE